MQNVLVATLHPLGLRPAIVNFDEVAAFTLERARREIARSPDDPRCQDMAARLDAVPNLPRRPVGTTTTPGPFLTVHLRKNGIEASVFTTIATIGTPIDATAEEIAIETYFPADEATSKLFRQLSS